MDGRLAYAILFFGSGIVGFFWGFQRLRRKRLIENIPTSTIRSLALGLVEICGKTKRTKLLKSPLTGTECVFYKYIIKEHRRSGRNSSWVTVAKGDSVCCPFILDDGTGQIMVFPKDAELFLPVDYKFNTRFGTSIPTTLTDFMDRNGVRYRSFLGNRTMMFQEWYIREGETVYVLGTAKKAQSCLHFYRDILAQRLDELKINAEKMKSVDTNKDGVISPEEWDAAVEKVEKELIEEEIVSFNGKDCGDVVIGRGDEEKIYIISDSDQKGLLNKLDWQSVLGIYGGSVLSLAALFYLILYVNRYLFYK